MVLQISREPSRFAQVRISVDTSPIASTTFGMMPVATTTPASSEDRYFASTAGETQKLLTNRILRCLERTILVGGALDTEALCVQSGAWVWRLSLAVRILDHGGNLMDASVLASMAALRHYRKPQVELVAGGMPLLVHADAREPTPLPLHHTPLTISFALVHADDVALSSSTVAALVDPTEREELVQTGSISIAMNVHSEVCLLDFGGGCEIQPKQLQQCWKLAEKCILQLCEMLEKCLKEADEKAQNERLHRLQKLQQQPNLPPLLPPNEPPPQVPFWQEQDDGNVVDTTMTGSILSEEIQQAANQVQDQVEETYRLQALEYNQGHVAAKVKERRSKQKQQKQHEGALLTALLRSAKSQPPPREEVLEAETKETASLGPSAEQMDEFQQVAAKAAATSTPTNSVPPVAEPKAMDVDDDDEEAPTMLKSEFDSVKNESSTPAQKEDGDGSNGNDDIDDLAMAIKSKTKKKKKPKKSK